MNQRIVQLVDHGLVQFRIGALDGQLDLFVQFDSQVVNQPAESLERGLERQHADAHRVFPQRRRQPVDRFGDIPGCPHRPGVPATSLSRACTVTSSPTRLTS